MHNYGKYFHCKLYDKESIEKWNLPDIITDKFDFDENNYFFLVIPQEYHHEGHQHIHFTIYPTKYEKLHLMEVKLGTPEPELLNNILEILTKENYDIITSTMSAKTKTEYVFAIFFTIPDNEKLSNVMSKIKELKNVKKVIPSNFTCEGQCVE